MINDEYLHCALNILKLRAKIVDLHFNQISRFYYSEAKDLRTLDQKLLSLYKGLTQYDFLSRIKIGNTLFVGEGNLSFTTSLVNKLDFIPNIIASTYESYIELSEYAKFNNDLLSAMGIKILNQIDATELHETFHFKAFNTIIFQFPHSGSREGVDGLNANYVLIKNFILSAAQVLKEKGSIIITIVDSDFYNNMFRLDELAEELYINPPVKYSFDPKYYTEYEHTMTHQNGSGIDDYSKFATYEFIL